MKDLPIAITSRGKIIAYVATTKIEEVATIDNNVATCELHYIDFNSKCDKPSVKQWNIPDNIVHAQDKTVVSLCEQHYQLVNKPL